MYLYDVVTNYLKKTTAKDVLHEVQLACVVVTNYSRVIHIMSDGSHFILKNFKHWNVD